MEGAMIPDKHCIDVIKNIHYKYCDVFNNAHYSWSVTELINLPGSYVVLMDNSDFGLTLSLRMKGVPRGEIAIQTMIYNSEDHITYERALDYMVTVRWDRLFPTKYKDTLLEALQNLYPKPGSLTKKASTK